MNLNLCYNTSNSYITVQCILKIKSKIFRPPTMSKFKILNEQKLNYTLPQQLGKTHTTLQYKEQQEYALHH